MWVPVTMTWSKSDADGGDGHPYLQGNCKYWKSGRRLVVLQVGVEFGANKLLTVKQTSILRYVTEGLALGLILWYDGLRKRKWTWDMEFHVSGDKVIENRNKRINKVKSSSRSCQLRQRWHWPGIEWGPNILLWKSEWHSQDGIFCS
jgi:hypothetical protein